MAKIIVRRSNEVLRVEDYLKQSFIDNGYDVIDEAGNVIQRAIPSDPIQLKAEVVRLTAEVESLKKQLAEKVEVVKEEKPKRTKKADAQ